MERKHDIPPPPTNNGYGSVSRDYCVESEDHRAQGKRNGASALLRHLLNPADDFLEQVQLPLQMSLFPVHPSMFTEDEQGFGDSGFSSKSLFCDHHPSPTGTAGGPQL